eukprot:CAMPEP_0183300726 /NCGR_PEP_ID=MMETSP0160_2-20130417/7047_1 /TAXON_ID=2839 ORGANISM="Odontella Sinensis, Strain Grunow 1884" /NCGR_SAMPLE_ID=MMETSP0160_2 /ASSEMBLY_ACC=CAM_ASM_000250 /LENGTH=141 /DNA_ID=CAMNT_0025463195 /DNA_START=61 /DNA_END=489 /DNA_ORIENTATION=+
MTKPDRRIQTAFQLAMCYNLAIVLFSKGFSDDLGTVDPLFDSVGSKLIALWGLAYGALADVYHLVPAASLVFAAEKGLYAHRWLVWLGGNSHRIGEIYERDFFNGVFFGLYGVGDTLSMLLFFHAAWTSRGNFNAFKTKSR